MKNVKKLLALLLAMTMLFALCACGDDTKKDDAKKDDAKKPEASQSANADPSAEPSTAPTTNTTTENKAPIGTWLLEEYNALFTLNYDGTGALHGQAITWELLSENSLRLSAADSQAVTLTFSYQGDAVCFIDEDGEESVWVKYTGSIEEEPDIEDEPAIKDEPDIDVEITYDANLIATWYGDDGSTLDLAEGGNGTLYLGDSEEYEVAWGVADGVLCLSYEDQDMYILYEIDGDNMTLTFEDGDVSTFIR